MDDLYNNAWGDPDKPSEDTSVVGTHATWTSPKPSLPVHDEEADLAAPSWSTGAEIRWNEPSGDSHGFAWSHAEPDLAWSSSTYEAIQIVKPPQTIVEEDVGPSSPESVTDVQSTSPTVHVAEEPIYESLNSSPGFNPLALGPGSPSSLSDTPHNSPPQSPDGFGSFTSAVEAESIPHLDVLPELEADAWGTAWASDKDNEVETEESVDEWEAARRQKEAQDRKVPPEVAADILSKCEEFCKQFPSEPNKDALDTDPDSWRNNLRSGLEGIDGLDAKMKLYAPELTLEPPLRFEKTVAAKKMTNSLRLTRNLPMVKQSPMSIYMAMKGNTAWETAVKDWKGTAEDDVVPVGWRILEKESTTETPAAAPQKPTGRLFSFWGRKQTSSPGTLISSSTAASSSSVAVNATATTSSSSSPRPSVDSTRSSNKAKKTASSTVSSPIAEAGPSFNRASLPPERSISPPAARSQSPTFTGSLTSSYADAPLPEVERSQTAPGAAPSAVSRFLNRFSRRRSTIPTNPNSSIALSSDDLTFLSDIVPSASEDHNEDHSEDALIALSKSIKPEPLPPVLPPPPSILSSSGASAQAHAVSPPGVVSSKGLPPNPRLNSLDSFFDSLQGPVAARQNEAKGNQSADLALLSPPPSSILSPTPAPSSRPQSPSGPVLQSRGTRPSSPSPLSSGFTDSQLLSQPFAIPPPPHSRSETPMPLRDHNLPTLDLSGVPRPSTLPQRPSIPSSFKDQHSSVSQTGSVSPLASPTSGVPLAQLYRNVLPTPATSSSSRPPTPMSAKPLAQLYPGAAARSNSPASSNPSPRSVAQASSKPLSAFTIPPPPSSRPHTPAAPAVPRTQKAGITPLLPPPGPPPSQPTRASHMPTISLTSFDDDDFDDFQTSLIPSKANPPTSNHSIPPLQPPISLPQSRPKLNLAPVLSPLSPPPSTPNSLLTHPQAIKPPISDPFDDDFSEFHSPSPSTLQHPSSFSLGASSSSKQGLLPAQGSNSSGFDNFDSFSPTLRTPSPPRPPEKLPIPALSAPKDDVPVGSLPAKGQSRAARHQHTLSLVALAASRKGQWPAPPSPLPQPLSFLPPSFASNSKAGGLVDLMGEDEPLGTFNSGSIGTSASSPAMFNSSSSNPPNGLGSLLSPTSQSTQTMSSSNSGQWLVDSGKSPMSAGSVSSNGTSTSKGTGKLSAQDLSFFEGL
ncbi:unnamed protein product [Somion occarium]|uniref:Uncharacterized protein n=1 Tax=Somion occarium TaxID=3059160 RepID=A0ABP1E5X3_9APHY